MKFRRQNPDLAFLAKPDFVDKNPDLQAWLWMTWLSCDLHSKPLPKYFPPMEAATAADLAQAFEPILRRLRQQPT